MLREVGIHANVDLHTVRAGNESDVLRKIMKEILGKRKGDMCDDCDMDCNEFPIEAACIDMKHFLEAADSSQGSFKVPTIVFMLSMLDMIKNDDLPTRTQAHLVQNMMAWLSTVIVTDPFVSDPLEHYMKVVRKIGFGKYAQKRFVRTFEEAQKTMEKR